MFQFSFRLQFPQKSGQKLPSVCIQCNYCPSIVLRVTYCQIISEPEKLLDRYYSKPAKLFFCVKIFTCRRLGGFYRAISSFLIPVSRVLTLTYLLHQILLCTTLNAGIMARCRKEVSVFICNHENWLIFKSSVGSYALNLFACCCDNLWDAKGLKDENWKMSN